MLFHCAYNFPAVLLTLGPSFWPELKPLHQQLVRDIRPRIRRTLACSLHEVAKILGPSLAESELMAVLLHCLKDNDEVREGALKFLPDFLETL
jgi:hypothetical protein